MLPRWMIGASAVLALSAGAALAAPPPGIAALDVADRPAVEAIVAGAIKEGSLAYSDSSIQPGTNDKLVEAFKTYYGLPPSFTVHYAFAGSLALITRVEQELGAGRVTLDVAAVGNPPWAFQKQREGAFMEYESPEYRHYQAVFDMGLGMPSYFAFNGGYVFVPVWNADSLTFKGTSWNDVVGAVPDGRLGYSDASQSATQLISYFALRKVLPVAFFRKIAAMHPFFSNRSQQVTDRLITSQDLMTFAGQPNRVYQYNQKGADLKMVYPSEGVPFVPQATFILQKAPHPNAAKLWIDFILSSEGQTILADQEGLVSGRSGFTSPNPTYAPTLAALKIIKVDWKDVTPQAIGASRAEWVSIFQR